MMSTELQQEMRSCIADNEEKIKCEQKYPQDQCEECGMVYVKKCHEDQIRLDCGICTYRCPEGTKPAFKGTYCLKPSIHQRKLFQTQFSCEQSLELGQKCFKKEKFWIQDCPNNYRALGQFFCDFVCPAEKFEDTRLACVPKVTYQEEYYSSSFVNPFGKKTEEM